MQDDNSNGSLFCRPNKEIEMTNVGLESAGVEERDVPAHGVTFPEAVRVWTKVAALSFGGPAGQIAVMHRILVEEKKWIG